MPGGREGARGRGARNRRAAGERAVRASRLELSGRHRRPGAGQAWLIPEQECVRTEQSLLTLQQETGQREAPWEPPRWTLPSPHAVALPSCLIRSDILTTPSNAGLGVGVPVLCRGAFLRVRGLLRVHQGLGGPPTTGRVREDGRSFSGAVGMKGHLRGPPRRKHVPLRSGGPSGKAGCLPGRARLWLGGGRSCLAPPSVCRRLTPVLGVTWPPRASVHL